MHRKEPQGSPGTAEGRPRTQKAREIADNFRREGIWITIGAVIFAACFGYQVWPHLSSIALANDWDYHLQLRWVPFYTILHCHQLPNPYRCGGVPMLGHRQSAFVSPFLLLDLLLGPIVGTHLHHDSYRYRFRGGYFLARVIGSPGWDRPPRPDASRAARGTTSTWRRDIPTSCRMRSCHGPSDRFTSASRVDE